MRNRAICYIRIIDRLHKYRFRSPLSSGSPASIKSGLILLGFSLMALLGTGCAGHIRCLTFHASPEPDFEEDRESLHLLYLGTGGFYMRRGDDAIMTAPFYSNPGLLRLAGGGTRADEKRIEKHLPKLVDDVPAILVGHAHYDHAMDLPYIAQHRAKQARIYGSDTLVNILLAALPEDRLESVECRAGGFAAGKPIGEWIPDESTRVRFMALDSMHAPHVWRVKFFSGQVTEPQTKLPRCVWGWKEGTTYAYLIDFLSENQEIDYRILYLDSAAHWPDYGGLPQSLLDERRPDVAILTMASFKNVRNYPEGVVCGSDPRNIVVGHWEDFFRSPDCPPKVVRLTNGRKFMTRLEKSADGRPVFLPKPRSWVTIGRTRESEENRDEIGL